MILVVLLSLLYQSSCRTYGSVEYDMFASSSMAAWSVQMYSNSYQIINRFGLSGCCERLQGGVCPQRCRTRLRLSCYGDGHSSWDTLEFGNTRSINHVYDNDNYWVWNADVEVVVESRTGKYANLYYSGYDNIANVLRELWDVSMNNGIARFDGAFYHPSYYYYGDYFRRTCTITNENQFCRDFDGQLICRATFTGPTECQGEIDVCQHNPCTHNGRCRHSDGVARCECLQGTSGQFCELLACTIETCRLGFCGSNQADCSCPAGTTGENCRESICPTGYCRNGQCKPNGNGYYCECDVKQYTGEVCQYQCPAACEHGKCILENNIPTCHCDEGFQGATCNNPIATNVCPTNHQCINDSECVPNADVRNPYLCNCKQSWEGRFCEFPTCSTSTCVNGQCLRGRGCVCAVGYFGPRCEQTACSSRTICQNGGSCEQMSQTSTRCNCRTDFAGVDCRLRCIPGCGPNGICVETLFGVECQCRTGFTGPNCEQSVQETVCAELSCQNGAQCVENNDRYSCQCTEHWTGPTCSVPTCNRANCNHGTCFDSIGCICNVGFVGADCSIITCIDDSHCFNQGRCLTSGQTLGCNCDTRLYTGDRCELSCGSQCIHGECQTDSFGMPRCFCFSGFMGEDCSEVNNAVANNFVTMVSLTLVGFVLFITLGILLASFCCMRAEKDIELHGLEKDPLNDEDNHKAWDMLKK